jgi:cystathionine gamma-synthase
MPTKISIDSDATKAGCTADIDLDDSIQASKSDLPPCQSSSKAEVDSSGSGTEESCPQGFSTKSVQGGDRRQKPEGAITAPIFTASTYTFESTDALLRFVDGKEQREEYGRYGNPNERGVEAKLTELEGSEDAILYSSGMAAIVGLLMSRLNSGDEIVFFDQCYHRSREFCSKHLSRFGVVTHQVPTGDFDAMEAAITPRTKMLVSESPTNPHLTAVDLEKFVAVGKANEVETLIDATLATPYNLRPIEFGVDFVLHSATKYLGGHNDLLAGVLCGGREALEPVRALRGILGSINSPHNMYLLERGLKTFELRMQRHNENGQRIAEFLESHPRVDRVYYPGLKSHPTHEIAAAQMRGFGGLVTFTIKDADWKETSRVVDAARIPKIAPSLGGVESLIEQPLVMSYYHCTPQEREQFGIYDNMIRMSCGVENTEDLIADLKQALEL